MSKLFKLKEFFTVEDAVKYLSEVLSEPISLADIYRLVLDEHIAISVRFLEPTYVNFCEKVELDESDDDEMMSLYAQAKKLLGETQTQSSLSLDKTKSTDSEFTPYSSESNRVDGIWDIKMAGAGSTEIERLYHLATDGLEIHGSSKPIWITDGEVIGLLKLKVKVDDRKDNLDLAYLKALDEQCQAELSRRGVSIPELCEYVEQNPDHRVEAFFKFITNESGPISDIGIEKFHSWFFHRMRSPLFEYHTSTSLAEHKHQLVIRTSELARFIDSLQEKPSNDKPLGTTERKTFYKLIFSFCHNMNVHPSDTGLTPSIQAMTENAKARISERTIRDILNEVSKNSPPKKAN